MAWIGVKEGVKKVLLAAFKNAFTEEFWSSLNPSTGQINPKDVVLDSFPNLRTQYPFMRVGVLLSALHWGNISMTEKNGETADVIGKGTFTCQFYALSSQARDKLSDGITSLLLFRSAFPGYNVFDQQLVSMAEEGFPRLNLDKGTLTFGTDEEGTGVAWEPNVKLYASSLQQGFSFEWAMSVDNLAAIIKEIDTTIQVKRT